MSFSINAAICARWDAKNLDAVITGGLSHGSAPEGLAATTPYAVYADVTGTRISGTRSSRYIRSLLQIDNYAPTDALADAHALAIRDALSHSDNAASNPLTANPVRADIVSIEPDGDPVASEESRDVWRVSQTFAIVYSEARNLAPTS